MFIGFIVEQVRFWVSCLCGVNWVFICLFILLFFCVWVEVCV